MDKPNTWLSYAAGIVLGGSLVFICAPPVPPQMPVVRVVAVERPVLPVPSLEPPVVCVEREPMPYPVQAVSVRWVE
jgi:hypothetical protein